MTLFVPGTVNSVTRASTSAFDLKLKASVDLRRAIKPLAKARVFVFYGNDLVSVALVQSKWLMASLKS